MSEPITDPSAERADRTLYEATAYGGPLDGQHLVSRFPKGVLAVNKVAGRAYVYDYQPAGDTGQARFACRDAAGAELDTDQRGAAADAADYEVVAV